MIIYIASTFLSIMISFALNKFFDKEKYKFIKMFIAIIPLTVVSAIRYDVGWDYLNVYTQGFYLVGEMNMDWFSEPIFMLIIKILYSLFKNPISLFVFMSIMVSLFFSLCYSAYGNEKKMWIYILLFVLSRYYFCSLNIIRQALAMMIVLYSVKFAGEKKIIPYTLFILLATSFHMLACMYIPLYFFLNRDYTQKKNLKVLLITAPIVAVMGIFFILNTKYVNYFKTMFGNDGDLVLSEVLISLSVLISSLFVIDKIREESNSRTLFNMSVITTVISLFSFLLPTPDRLIWYFSVNNIFFIPQICSYCEQKGKRELVVAATFIFFFLTLVFVNQTIGGDSYSVLPYQTIFDKKN